MSNLTRRSFFGAAAAAPLAVKAAISPAPLASGGVVRMSYGAKLHAKGSSGTFDLSEFRWHVGRRKPLVAGSFAGPYNRICSYPRRG